MKRATRGWVRKAESDFRLAAAIARGTEPFHDEQCFHCQQSAEKYLKALLEELGRPIPKTHDLNALWNCWRPRPGPRGGRGGAPFFPRDSGVITRPRGTGAPNRRAESPLGGAEKVRAAGRTLLGPRPPRPRRPRSP